MSKQACAEFFAKINTDAALQQELATALQGKEGDEATTAFVWVGAKHGYDFTPEEAVKNELYKEIIAAAEDELDDGALDQVAGGGMSRLDLEDRATERRLREEDGIRNPELGSSTGGLTYSPVKLGGWRNDEKIVGPPQRIVWKGIDEE